VGLGTTGLKTLKAAQAARTTVKAPYGWKDDDPDWRTRYGRVDPADRERLLALGEERRRQRAERASMNQQKEQEKNERA
jgi:D-proline reductase (dithiol) PrdB